MGTPNLILVYQELSTNRVIVWAPSQMLPLPAYPPVPPGRKGDDES
jgi:hypothetical protein